MISDELKRIFRAKPCWEFILGPTHSQFGTIYYVYDTQTHYAWVMTPFTGDEKLDLCYAGDGKNDARQKAMAWKAEGYMPDEEETMVTRVRKEVLAGDDSDYLMDEQELAERFPK
jgi:hypothetical protein